MPSRITHKKQQESATQLVLYVENATKKLGNVEKACDIIGIELTDYTNAKEMLEKADVLFFMLWHQSFQLKNEKENPIRIMLNSLRIQR